jgi:GAF domain-containing protein
LNSIRFRLAIGFAVIGILSSALSLLPSYRQSRDLLLKGKQDKLMATVANAALQIDGDRHAMLTTPGDMETDTYRELQRRINAIAATDDEILYIYTIRQNEDGSLYFVLDAGHEPGQTVDSYIPSEIGLIYEDPSDLLVKSFSTLVRPMVEPDFYSDEFGSYLTAYAPLYRSDGQREGVVAVDILAQDILAQQADFQNSFLLMFAGSAIVSAIIGWLTGTLLSRPVLILSREAATLKDTGRKLQVNVGIREVGILVDSFNGMLETLRTNEERLRDQAVRLDQQNEQLQSALKQQDKRAKQFEAIAQVARATTTNENLETLLPRLTTLISEKFGFYHAGIFLLDKDRTYAVLRAANSEGGKRMLTRQHKLRVGQTGMVGYVSAVGKPRIALDVGDDAVYFDNPDLPNTRSEMALPLRIGDEVIETLSTLADQVAVAIQNSRTFERMQELLEAAQQATASALRDAWRVLQSEETRIGYRASGEETRNLNRPVMSAVTNKVIKEKKTLTENGRNAILAVPIRLRDEVIGVMDIRTPAEHEWNEDEVDIAEAVADRLSLALETSLLLKSTQRRAEIERVTADISGKITATTQFDSILRTAAEELSRVLGGSEVVVQLQPEESPSEIIQASARE